MAGRALDAGESLQDFTRENTVYFRSHGQNEAYRLEAERQVDGCGRKPERRAKGLSRP